MKYKIIPTGNGEFIAIPCSTGDYSFTEVSHILEQTMCLEVEFKNNKVFKTLPIERHFNLLFRLKHLRYLPKYVYRKNKRLLNREIKRINKELYMEGFTNEQPTTH